MDDAQIVGAVIGGIIGFVIGTGIASPKFTYLGGDRGLFEKKMGCVSGCFVQIVLIAVGAGAGFAVGSMLSG